LLVLIGYGVLVLNEFLWKNRILLVLGDADTKSKQKYILDQAIEGILERDMVILGFEKHEEPYIKWNDTKLDIISEEFNLNSDDNIILFGKDGTIKAKWREPVTVEEIFQIIDAMPMRKAEIRRRKGGE